VSYDDTRHSIERLRASHNATSDAIAQAERAEAVSERELLPVDLEGDRSPLAQAIRCVHVARGVAGSDDIPATKRTILAVQLETAFGLLLTLLRNRNAA
jgi:hypothetical protein